MDETGRGRRVSTRRGHSRISKRNSSGSPAINATSITPLGDKVIVIRSKTVSGHVLVPPYDWAEL